MIQSMRATGLVVLAVPTTLACSQPGAVHQVSVRNDDILSERLGEATGISTCSVMEPHGRPSRPLASHLLTPAS